MNTLRDFWDQFSFCEKRFIELSMMFVKFALCLSLAGCGAVVPTSHSGLATAIVLVADADVRLTRPELPDSLTKQDVGAAPTASVKLPLVQFFVTDGCPPCREAKAWLSGQKRIPYVQMPENPPWTDEKGYPSFAWQLPDGTWCYAHGWTNGTDFEKRYFDSLKRVDPKHSA